MKEDKELILHYLFQAVKRTRAGEDVVDMKFHSGSEDVVVIWKNGFRRLVNVEADSGIAMIRDVLGAIR